MIVCNVTNMQSEVHSWTLMWFLLFPLNKFVVEGGMAPEWLVALIIYIVNMGNYATFVVCTISQITSFLDIYCLSIKQKSKAK